MPSLRSSGRITGNPVSLRQLAQQQQLASPYSMRALLRELGVRGDPEILFRYGTHNLSFRNFSDGAPDWGTFRETFGTAEVLHEQLDPFFGHPILTAAFYAFYQYFLKGTANGGLATGFCTSLASLVADSFWTGRTDTHALTKEGLHRHLTAVHGKLLSRESLLHFHEQGRDGVARVEKSCREIETTFLKGCGRRNAPLLFFIPAGEVWDSGYFDKLGSSHCVMPYRFRYPPGHPGPQLSPDSTTTVTDLNGVELYVWDCNAPSSPDCKLVLTNSGGGRVDFAYFPGGSAAQFRSEEGLTLGVMSNGNYLLADHDLPFSGPNGLTRFILDFLLSPADLQVTDQHGRRAGNFGGLIRAEIPDSHPCYLARGMYMLPDDLPLTRLISGTGIGEYAFHSLSPRAGSVVLQGVSTARGQVDLLMMNADRTRLSFAPAAAKAFNLILGRRVGDQGRGLIVRGAGGAPAADVTVAASPDLSEVAVGNQGAARRLEVSAVIVDAQNDVRLVKPVAALNVTAKSEIKVAMEDWRTLRAHVQALRL